MPPPPPRPAPPPQNVRMSTNIFVLAAICFPEAIHSARDEVDRICGAHAERLPSLDDMPNMPYVTALIKECLRWRPTVPLIPQHHLTQDLAFESYRFPAGTDFVINSPAVCTECADPNLFRPERWLEDPSGGGVENINHDLWQFGGGRRVCVGYKIAQQLLFLAYARLVYCFEFSAVSFWLFLSVGYRC